MDSVGVGVLIQVLSGASYIYNIINLPGSFRLSNIKEMNLSSKRIIGFGVGNKETFNTAVGYSKGAIIGSAFIKHLKLKGISYIDEFIKSIRS